MCTPQARCVCCQFLAKAEVSSPTEIWFYSSLVLPFNPDDLPVEELAFIMDQLSTVNVQELPDVWQ